MYGDLKTASKRKLTTYAQMNSLYIKMINLIEIENPRERYGLQMNVHKIHVNRMHAWYPQALRGVRAD
jgi:hypothetical protein